MVARSHPSVELIGILIFSLDLTGRDRKALPLFGVAAGLFMLKRFFAIINLRP